MSNQCSYAAILIEQEQEKGDYLVQFPDFPEAITQGDTINQALSVSSNTYRLLDTDFFTYEML